MKPALTTILVIGLALVAGCGDDDDGGNGSGSGGGGLYGGGGGGDGASGSGEAGSKSELRLTADPSGRLEFEQESLEARPGKVTIALGNPSQVPHAIEVEGNGVEEAGETVGKGGVSEVMLDLEAGEYVYYCPVGNHQDAGMEGTLTVE